MSRVPILTYHSIDNSGSIISTSPVQFQSQMQFLKESSFNVISLKDITQCIYEKRPFPPRAVGITFDDGFKNVYNVAYPILKKFGFMATVFLVTGYCGQNNQWKGQPKGIPTLDLLCWDEIFEMSKGGIDVGVHTMNHPDLTKISIEAAREEILNSKSMIQKQLGQEILFFAYPYGKETEEIKSLIRGEFYGACSTELDLATFKSDTFSLPRIDMYYFVRNNLFLRLGTPFFHSYIRYRNTLRTLKGKIHNLVTLSH